MDWTPRQHPRVKVNLSAELRQPVTPAPMRAQTADISLGGCYVEMVATRSISEEVDVTLWLNEKKIRAKAVVVSSHPQVGNGLKFTYMAPDDREELGRFIESLRHASRLMGVS